MARPPSTQTAEEAALQTRTRKFMRRQRPSGRLVGHKEGWVREFVALYDEGCWTALVPPMTRVGWLTHFGLTAPRVSEYRIYLQVFDAALAAGANGWHLARTPVKTLYALRAHIAHPNVLLRELLGEDSAAERQRVQRNARQRRLSRVKKQRQQADLAG